MSSNITTILQPDPHLVQDANYRFNSFDRQYIDDQAVGCEIHLANELINGTHATYVTLDNSSVAVVPGDSVCSAGAAGTTFTVLRANGGTLPSAGKVFGVVTQGGGPGSKIVVAISGMVSPAITGIVAPGAQRFAYVDPTTGKLFLSTTLSASNFNVGAVDASGWLTLNLLLFGQGASEAPTGPAGGDLTGTYPNPTIAQITGITNSVTVICGAIGFNPTANFISGPAILQANPTTDVAALSMSIIAQSSLPGASTNRVGGNLNLLSGSGSTTNGTPGNVIVSIASPSGTGTVGQFQCNISGHNSFVADNQGVVLGRTDASQMGMRIAPLIGQELLYSGIWTGSAATSPNGSNYTVALSGTQTSFVTTPGLILGSGNSLTFTVTNGSVGSITWAATVTSAIFLTQTQQVNGSNPSNFVVAPQAPGAGASTTATGTPGSFQINLATPVSTGADAAFIVNARGNNYATIQPLIGSPTGYAGLYMMPSVVPSATNYTLANSGATLIVNAPPAGTGQIVVGNSATAAVWSSTGWQFFGAQSLAGGSGVIGITNATTAPTGNPTGGIVAWANTNTFSLLSSTNASLAFGFGSTAFFAQPQQLAGTGATAGVTFSVAGQQGQQQTGAVANTVGGILALLGGPAGTGGTGANANGGSVQLKGGAPSTGGTGTTVDGLVQVQTPLDAGELTFTPAAGSNTLTLAQSRANVLLLGVQASAFTINYIRAIANTSLLFVRNPSGNGTATIAYLTGGNVTVAAATSALIVSDGSNLQKIIIGT